jgi:hypothetical protein
MLTRRTYLAAGIGRIHEDVMSDEDKRRFLFDVNDNVWIHRNHGAVLKRVRTELGTGTTRVTSGGRETIDAATFVEVDEEEEDLEMVER